MVWEDGLKPSYLRPARAVLKSAELLSHIKQMDIHAGVFIFPIILPFPWEQRPKGILKGLLGDGP